MKTYEIFLIGNSQTFGPRGRNMLCPLSDYISYDINTDILIKKILYRKLLEIRKSFDSINEAEGWYKNFKEIVETFAKEYNDKSLKVFQDPLVSNLPNKIYIIEVTTI